MADTCVRNEQGLLPCNSLLAALNHPLPLGLGIVERGLFPCYVMARSYSRGDYYLAITYCPFCGTPFTTKEEFNT